jgi:dTDP-4-amino-4,6-dideoxygalactose transaminase
LRSLAAGDRDEVVLPSYTCYSVAAAIVKAGLRPRVVDIDPDTLDYAAVALAGADYRRVLAIIAVNPYGLPSDLPAIVASARAHGAFVIDDAAQAMGAMVGGRPSGSWGDAGLFSFDKGKNVPAVHGGVVVTGSTEVAAAVTRQLAGLPGPSLASTAADVVKALASAVLLRPRLYWIPNAIPQLGLGRTVYSTDFPLGPPGRALTALAQVMIDRLDEFAAARRRNAAALAAGMARLPGFRAVAPRPGSEPASLRFPLLAADERTRSRALSDLRAAGIGASGSYPEAIVDIPELQGALAGGTAAAPGGRHVARHLVTLPTHPYVTGDDIALMLSVLRRLSEGASTMVAVTT